MDKTLHEHNTCIRQLLLKHSGYESATEGDRCAALRPLCTLCPLSRC